jgi:gamma-glutamylcyclotransferase (GGCT)/AIG2-like uncharacterized protein YtfP
MAFVSLDGVRRALRPVAGWRWIVAGTGEDLDTWLGDHGAAPTAARVPVLGAIDPPPGAVVVLRARRAGEWHALWLLTAEQAATVPRRAVTGLVNEDGIALPDVRPDHTAAEWPDRLFVYGTLRPGSRAWHLLAPHVAGTPVAGALDGVLYDTGYGYPAFRHGDGAVPGWTVTLRAPVAAFAELDEYEGDDYRRVRVVDSGGRLCWTYLWTAPVAGLRVLPDGWAD